MTPAVCHMIWLRAAACGRSSGETSRGVIAERVGITTLVPYRRRGIAASLTAYATQAALALGVDLAFLSTSDSTARRAYDRLGFRACAHNLTFGFLTGHRGS